MSEKILFVDDEPSILEGIRRTLGRRLAVATADGPQEGLRMIVDTGPYAVVVSDMRMPGMSGVQLLAAVRRLSPSTVRMMLTGQADVDATIAAVNDGHVFRFLTKPCGAEVLLAAVSAGLSQYQLIMAEKELLEQTLAGAVQVLTDILAIINPVAYGRAARITRYAESMSHVLEPADRWQVRLAAMLSQIGWVSLPEDMVIRVGAGEHLDPAEQRIFDQHREVAARLISTIPRLNRVAAIIGGGAPGGGAQGAPDTWSAGDLVSCGRAIVAAASQFDQLMSAGIPRTAALAQVAIASRTLPAAALEALASMQASEADMIRKSVALKDLLPGMVLDDHVFSAKGLMLMKRGLDVTPTLIARLRSYADGIGVTEPIRVHAPAGLATPPSAAAVS